MFSALAALLGASCATTAPQQKSTGTNWLTCGTDTDCAGVEGAACSDQHVCVDANGQPVSRTRVSENTDASDSATENTMTGAGGTSGSTDAGAGCPPWSALVDGQGYPVECTHSGLVCTYAEGQAECAPDGAVLKWWQVGRGQGCPERRPVDGSSCTSAGTTCGYISGLPSETDYVEDSCCDGNTHRWGPNPTNGCPNGNTCGTIAAAAYDQKCTVDSDCVLVTEGDLCQSFCDNCSNATISASAQAQYQADFAMKSSTASRICPCAFIPAPVCKQGVCAMGSLP